MQQGSRSVISNQTGPHEDVARRVARALQNPLRKPLASHNQRAFEQADDWRQRQCAPLILDAGCGVGVSTRRLAQRFPDHAVIGVDRSADRLSRDHGSVPENACLIRADLVDFWRLAVDAGWSLARHYLLYPNPYPKAGHLKMRWHGHPVLPAILTLGGLLDLRSNWKVYVEEFAQAVTLVTSQTATVESHDPQGDYLTPFETKYAQSGQALWRLSVSLEPL